MHLPRELNTEYDHVSVCSKFSSCPPCAGRWGLEVSSAHWEETFADGKWGLAPCNEGQYGKFDIYPKWLNVGEGNPSVEWSYVSLNVLGNSNFISCVDRQLFQRLSRCFFFFWDYNLFPSSLSFTAHTHTHWFPLGGIFLELRCHSKGVKW